MIGVNGRQMHVRCIEEPLRLVASAIADFVELASRPSASRSASPQLVEADRYVQDRGKWFLEAAFRPLEGSHRTFETLEAALEWLARKIGFEAEQTSSHRLGA